MFRNKRIFSMALACWLLSGMIVFGEDSKKTTVETYPLAADKTLTLDLQAGGNLTITGWDNHG